MPDRLRAAMKRAGVSQSELARRVGVSSSMIGKLVRGQARESAHIYKIATALDTTAEYISGEAKTPDGYASHGIPALADDLDLVAIREFDLSLGMGGAFLEASPAENVQHFPRSWIRHFTSSPAEDLFFAHAIGDSMTPTMLSGDIILIDRRQRIVDQADLIWAFTFGGLGMIKRIGAGRDGTVRIISDNQNVRTDVVVPDDLNIIGRIVAIVRRM